jgi:hypothetical protein
MVREKILLTLYTLNLISINTEFFLYFTKNRNLFVFRVATY